MGVVLKGWADVRVREARRFVSEAIGECGVRACVMVGRRRRWRNVSGIVV